MHFWGHLRKLGALAVAVMALGLMGAAESCAKMRADHGDALISLFNVFPLAANSEARVVIYRLPVIFEASRLPTMTPGEFYVINNEIDWMLEQLQKLDPRFLVKGAGTAAEEKKVHDRASAIIWDVDLSRQERVRQIIEEILVPAEADLLIFGNMYYRGGSGLVVRMFAVFRHAQNLVSETRLFSRAEMSCTKGENLCDEVRKRILEEIHDTLSARLSGAGRL